MPKIINHSLVVQRDKSHGGCGILPSLLLVSFAALSLDASAQSIRYTYDGAGNRVSKVYVHPMSRAYDNGNILQQYGKQDLAADILVSAANNLVSVVIVNYDETTECDISISSTDGKLLKAVHANSPTTHINIEDMVEGVYLLNVTNKGDKRVWKIVKK